MKEYEGLQGMACDRGISNQSDVTSFLRGYGGETLGKEGGPFQRQG